MKAAHHHDRARRPSEGQPKPCHGMSGHPYAIADRAAFVAAEAIRIERELVELENETRRCRGMAKIERIEDVCFH